MAATVTVTGKAGPALTVTAVVVANVTDVRFATEAATNMLYLTTSDKPQIQEFDISAAATITATKSGGTYTFAIS